MFTFHFYKQLDAMDCGPACLRMVARHYGKEYSIQYLRERSFITREGVSMMGISEAAESIGLRTQGFKLSWEQLRDQVNLPCVVHWNQNHFVLVFDIKTSKNNFLRRLTESARRSPYRFGAPPAYRKSGS